jgi:hypothetical protein
MPKINFFYQTQVKTAQACACTGRQELLDAQKWLQLQTDEIQL